MPVPDTLWPPQVDPTLPHAAHGQADGQEASLVQQGDGPYLWQLHLEYVFTHHSDAGGAWGPFLETVQVVIREDEEPVAPSEIMIK